MGLGPSPVNGAIYFLEILVGQILYPNDLSFKRYIQKKLPSGYANANYDVTIFEVHVLVQNIKKNVSRTEHPHRRRT